MLNYLHQVVTNLLSLQLPAIARQEMLFFSSFSDDKSWPFYLRTILWVNQLSCEPSHKKMKWTILLNPLTHISSHVADCWYKTIHSSSSKEASWFVYTMQVKGKSKLKSIISIEKTQGQGHRLELPNKHLNESPKNPLLSYFLSSLWLTWKSVRLVAQYFFPPFFSSGIWFTACV